MNILVRLPNWLGDMVMSTAFLDALSREYPNAKIHLVVKNSLQDLAGHFKGSYVIHPFDKKKFPGLRGAFRFGRRLHSLRFDLFVSLPDSFSSAVMGWASGALTRIGYKKEARSLLLTKSFPRPTSLHRAEAYLELLRLFTGKNYPKSTVGLRRDLQNKEETFIAVNFNSEASSRRMPIDKGRAILESLAERFPDRRIVLIGAPSEVTFVERFLEPPFANNQVSNAAGSTELNGLIRLLSSASLLLSTDSGPAHLANSLGIPVIVLFGAGNEQQTAPFRRENLTVLRAGKLPCEPCVKNKCPLYELPECMKLLDQSQINESVTLYLNNA